LKNYLITIICSCSSDNAKSDENHESEGLTTSRGEHSRDGGEEGGSKGEESGTEYSLNDTYDNVRKGARLILAYDTQSNLFKGTVENVTGRTLKKVRVEVHLSNGIELGPTTSTNLDPGEKIDLVLPATDKKFDKWSAHPEVGSGEHSHGEGEGEHDGKRSSEHKGEHN